MQDNHRFKRLISRRSALTGGFATIAAVGAGTVPAMCRGRVYPGARFAAAQLGGKSPEEAESELRRELAGFEERAITYAFENEVWHASLADLGFSIDYDAMIDIAMGHGRENGPLDRYKTFVRHDTPNDVPLVLKEDGNGPTSFLNEIAGDIDIAPTDARLEMIDGEVTVQPEKPGRAVDIDEAIESTLDLLKAGKPASLPISTRPVDPKVTQNELDGAKADAWNLIKEPIVFTHEELDYPVTPEDLTRALQIDSHNQASLDPSVLRERFEQINSVTKRESRNVMLGWDSGLYVVQEDVDGAEVDYDKMEDLAVELSMSSDRHAELAMKPVKAAARADNIAELGIDTHLAYGSSSFVGSSAARAENVRVSARNISYKLVAPGETFSYNDLQGPITEDHGYVSGTIISGNWVESDIGGGVCQVSTTVFRAAAKAGFRFSEWNPHSWRLAFYEADGSDPGLDAAIYQAESEWEWSLDLTFKNTLDSWLLIVVTTEGDWVTAHLYGKDPGWNVEMHPAQVSAPIQPGPVVERENPALAPGERRMVQTAQPGYVVSVRRVISAADGEVLADGNFVSDYVPQPEAWEVGPR